MPKLRTYSHEVPAHTVETALDLVEIKLFYRLNQKGSYPFASPHEILGIITEEYLEYAEAVHLNKNTEELVEELKDLAVAAIFAIASLHFGEVD